MQSNDCCCVVDALFAAADDVAVHCFTSMLVKCSCPRSRGSDKASLVLPFVEAIIPKEEALVLVFNNEVAKDATLD